MKRNIKLTLEYDGTNYHGWQSQAGSGRPTIQNALEDAIKALAHEELKTNSSGRTDAGVHALGHVVNFKTSSSIPPAAWAPALNHLLPHDIRVLASEEVPQDFHSRYSAIGKTYKYRILSRRSPTALYRNYAWHVNLPLNLARMRRAIILLVGKHDFSAFRGSGCSAKTTVRTIRTAIIRKVGDFVELSFEADAFLQYMVRNIAGTLVEVGLARFRPDDVKHMLESRDRKLAGRTAPPQGLYLVDVSYPE
ncbi:MAG: tRNA pseudouridine(38-40) synthase TruA [Betaproteobacteria bacterium]